MTNYTEKNEILYPHEYEQASNSYLMAVATVIAGLPLPIINVIAAFGYYLGQRKSSYFVRWHCIQAVIAQAIMIPFNSIAFAWTISILYHKNIGFPAWKSHYDTSDIPSGMFTGVSIFYFMYIFAVLFFNLIEFFTVVYTAGQVRKGHNIRWFGISSLADMLTSKENRDIYKI